jgi:hypothetical protein
MRYRYSNPPFKIDYLWSNDCSKLAPGSYMTRLGTSKVWTVRYFDGKRWWTVTGGAKPMPKDKMFKLPPKNRNLYNQWIRKASTQGRLCLRNITDQAKIQWGTPYKIFSDAEVIKHLIRTQRLPYDWQTAFQMEMQGGPFVGTMSQRPPVEVAIDALTGVVALLKTVRGSDAQQVNGS